MDRLYKIYCYWRIHGYRAVLNIVFRKLSNNRSGHAPLAQDAIAENGRSENVAGKLEARFQSLSALRTYTLPDFDMRRINIVTDSIGAGSLFGGVGTALIFASLLANELNVGLRIITRTERGLAKNFENLLKLYKIELKNEVQFLFAAFYDSKYEMDVGRNDIFLTTSWWTTAATLLSVPSDKIIYILQEDERMFYPYGDDRYKCENILNNSDIRFVINTKLLYDHFVQEGFDNIERNGDWFEPAFPSYIYYPRIDSNKVKKKFFFYARPNNPRNLFYLGLQVIERVVQLNIIDLREWDIYLVGKDIPIVTFDGGYSPVRKENLNWSDYAELLGSIDLGLSLMYTPHPSYPPLDLAASGAVVVTNRHKGKSDLSEYSKNILCSDLNLMSLVDSIKNGVSVVEDKSTCDNNFKNNGLSSDWNISLGKLILKFAEEK